MVCDVRRRAETGRVDVLPADSQEPVDHLQRSGSAQGPGRARGSRRAGGPGCAGVDSARASGRDTVSGSGFGVAVEADKVEARNALKMGKTKQFFNSST